MERDDSEIFDKIQGKVDIIFLDIDGVLLPFNHSEGVKESCCGVVFPDRTLEALDLIVRETNARIVLSSTWRNYKSSCQYILGSFEGYGKQKDGSSLASIRRFYDMTDTNYRGCGRQFEIYHWLEQNKDVVRSWIALDDEELLEGKRREAHREEFEGHVVKTDRDVGLTMEQAREAINLMNAQKQEE